MAEEILRMSGIYKSFGGCKALTDVDFACNRGEVHVLAGENGAGKSTILKILAGLFEADRGEICLKGEKVKIRTPRQSQDMGIAMVFQELTLVGEMTVEENLFLNMEPVRFGVVDRKKIRRQAETVMEQYGITIDLDAIVCRLTVAQQQMVEIIKILLHDPELIILDEPTSALARKEVEKLFQIVRNLIEKGKTIIFISHRLEEVFEIGDRVTVFKDGERVDTKLVSEIDTDDLIRMMVGRSLQNIFPPKNTQITEEVLFEVKELTGKALRQVSFAVKKGEILGIAGLQGHGQTELMNAISGLYPLEKGEIRMKGREIKVKNAKAALKNKIALVPSDRKTEGLMLGLPVRDNLALCSLGRRARMGVISASKEKAYIDHSVKSLSIKVFNVNNPVASLSGGNQQKVVLGKELGIDPDVILFHEPTRGIDVEAKNEFYNIMKNLAKQGTAVIMCSSDMMEVIGMSNRVAVMYEGAVTQILEGEDITEENIMRCAMGISV